MSDMKSMQEMIKDHMEVCPDFSPQDPRGTFLALALSGEAGELANLFKKEWRDGDDAAREAKKMKEAGDVMAYLLMLEAHEGWDLRALVERSLLEFEARPEYQKLLESRRK
jgi:NTP pyrophosphatase (non-canonical NTP hydrolase)